MKSKRDNTEPGCRFAQKGILPRCAELSTRLEVRRRIDVDNNES